MTPVLYKDIESLIGITFAEDIREGDVTSQAIFPKDHHSTAFIRSKDAGIFCGGFLGDYIYHRLDSSIEVVVHKKEGEAITFGDVVMTISGPTELILTGERTLLNFLQRMCGISTRTKRIVALLEGSNISILDTRKTLPGFRLLDKYAVKAGGGRNHRMGLYDMVMIKDNHIKAAGSIASAVAKVKDKWGNRYKIEVETTGLDEIREAINAGADIIMLDNMDKAMMQQATALINKQAEIELSGNMDEEKIVSLRDLDVDYISMGALTHSVTAFDLSMKFE